MRVAPGLAACLLVSLRAFANDLETKELHSEAIAQDVKVNVVLPDGYKDDSSRRFPVIYLLHGYGGDYSEWTRVGVKDESTGLPVIIVMPEGDRSFYVNHHEDAKAKWEDYIVTEIVAWADKTYRTVPDRAHRGVSGLSMGGYGAMALGLRHPDVFCTAASHSGAVGVPGDSVGGEIADRLQKIFGPAGTKEREAYDLFVLAKGLAPERRPHIYIDCGSSDFLLESNRKFVAHLATLKIPYEYRESPGTHDFKYWKANVRYSLTRQLEAMKTAPVSLAANPAADAKPAGEGKPAAGSIAGDWDLIVKFQDSSNDYVLKLAPGEGGKLSGILVSPRSGEHKFKEVSFKDGALHMEIERDFNGMAVTMLYSGKLDGGKLSGKVTAKEFEGFEGEFQAERKKASP